MKKAARRRVGGDGGGEVRLFWLQLQRDKLQATLNSLRHHSAPNIQVHALGLLRRVEKMAQVAPSFGQ